MQDTITPIPPYVYRDTVTEVSLLQGDILTVDKQFRDYFTKFYPEIKHPEGEIKYVMVLSQSCDLVKEKKRRPKLTHINVCLVRSIKAVVERIIKDEIEPTVIKNNDIEIKLLERVRTDSLKDRLSKLLNNSDQKTFFFLPCKSPFNTDMVALLPLSFSFRSEHYELLLQNRVLGLKPEFQGKVGNTISHLYGRIGTTDLSDHGWNSENTRNYIKLLLKNLNLTQVTDESYIQYIKDHFSEKNSNIDSLIQEHQAQQINQSFLPLKNELFQQTRSGLIKAFGDEELLSTIMKLRTDKIALSQKVKEILQSIFNS